MGRSAISAAIGADQPLYVAHATDGDAMVVNAAKGVWAELRSNGATVGTWEKSVTLSLVRVGRAKDMAPIAPAKPEVKRNRVEFRRGWLVEWYVNGPAGLEQGFTFEKRPEGDGSLMLEFRLLSGAKAAPGRDGRSARFSDSQGRAVVRYAGLAAFDAEGRELPAKLLVAGSALSLAVDDVGAVFPVTIDPVFESAKLTASDGAAFDDFGNSVAVSGDTVVVGAPRITGLGPELGTAYVFVKPSGGWATTSSFDAKLTASDGAIAFGSRVGNCFGCSVAIDGDTIVVGASFTDIGSKHEQGAAYVFVRPGGWFGFLTETAKLTSADGAAGDNLGKSVAISGDTIVVAAPSWHSNQGAAYLFEKPVAGWSTTSSFAAKLTASDGAPNDELGLLSSLAVSGDTVIAGTGYAKVGGNASQGAAYVFVKPAGGWSGSLDETAKLTASDGANGDLLGFPVAIDGDTVVAGADGATIGSNAYQGAAYVFVKPATGWVTTSAFASKLTASDGSADDLLGAGVAISGNTVVAGLYPAIGSNQLQGAVYVFEKPTGGWVPSVTSAVKLIASDAAYGDSFGVVAISGHLVVKSAPNATLGSNTQQGAAYVFEISSQSPCTPDLGRSRCISPVAPPRPLPVSGR